MSIVFNKSKSENYKKYFEQRDNFELGFNKYSIVDMRIKENIKNFVISEQNRGGIPLSWNMESNEVAIDQTDAHSLIIGPTGSKKTRLLAMPMVRVLGVANESMIISDPKAEILLRTADALCRQGYQVDVINLRQPDYSAGWNPLAIPYHFYCTGDIDKAYEFANDVAQNLIPVKADKDPFWENSAASLLFGLILLLFKYCKEYNLGQKNVCFDNIIELRNRLFRKKKSLERENGIWEYARQDPFIESSMIGSVETASDTQAGILSTFDQAVRDFSIQPNLLNMLCHNDIDFDDFLKRKHAVYLVMPDEKTNYHKLISLFVKQSYEYLIYLAQRDIHMDGISTGILPKRINYILDEFSSLPTIKDFPAMITAARSRNIRFTLIMQSRHQLTQRYQEETETIMANCTNWIFLTTRELSLLKEMSELCGTKEGKPILSVALLQRLSKEDGEMLVLSGRCKPYVTQMPDIDIFDKKNFLPFQLQKCPMENRERLAFKEIDIVEQSPFCMDSYKGNKGIDEIIKRIDKKIAELEEEENREKGGSGNDDAERLD